LDRGHTVAQGTVIGRVTDFFGKTLQEIRAPFAGEVLYVVGTPAMNEGEPVAFIGSASSTAPSR
jgi:predicted deacylase